MRTPSRLWPWAGVLVLAVVLGTPSWTARAQPPRPGETPKYGGSLVWGFEVEPPMFDPHRWGGTDTAVVISNVYSTLFKWTYGGKIVNDLVERWSAVSPTEFEFRLRRGVKFHDGAALTTRDVEYSIGRILEPATGAVWRTQLAVIKKVEIVDDLRFKLHLSSPIAPDLLREILSMPHTAIVSRDWMAKPRNFALEHNGSGPFRWVERRPGISILVERNPNYYEEGRPYLNRILFVIYPDEELRTTALKTGVIHVNHYLPWKDIDSMSKDPGVVVSMTRWAFMDITFNVRTPPFTDRRVRRAIGYAVDRKAIVDAAFFGHGEPLWGAPLSGSHMKGEWYYNPDTIGFWEHSPAKARELLREAGYPTCFSASILTSADHHMHWVTAEIVQAGLNAIGCKISVDKRDWVTRVTLGNRDQYAFSINGKGPFLRDPDMYMTWYHSKISPFYHRPAGYDFPELDALLERARTLPSYKERMALYKEFERKFLEESPAIMLVYRGQPTSFRKNVRGLEALPGPGWPLTGYLLESTWLE